MKRAPLHRVFYAKFFLKVFYGLLVILLLTVCATNIWIVMLGQQNISEEKPIEKRDYVIVLGAGVRGQELSGALKSRMIGAVHLYQNKLVSKILVSGDGTDPYYNETLAMKKFAVKNEIPEADIESDALGFSTYDSILRARSVFKIQQAYVVSQKFHLIRILWLAQAVGIDAKGVSAGLLNEDWYYLLREIPARTKDFFLHFFNFEPATTRDKIF